MIKPHIQQDPSKNPIDLGVIEQIMVMEIIMSVILLFVGIAVLVLIHICIVGRAFRQGFLNQEGESDDHGVVHRARNKSTCCGLSDEELKRIPWFDYKEGQKGVDCAVCLESFKVGDKCRLLPSCHHCFHLQCVDLWLMKVPFCPICRATARPEKKSIDLVMDEIA